METYLNCDKCGKDIRFGEKHVSLSKYIEYVEYVNERNRTEAEVIDAVNLITLCESCGETLSSELISKIKQELFNNNPSMNA